MVIIVKFKRIAVALACLSIMFSFPAADNLFNNESLRTIKIAEAAGGDKMTEKIVQTAGRDRLGTFAPEFAHFNDDVLFGENWNNQDIDVKTRSIITVVALMSSGITDSSLKYHLQNAKNHGVSQKEISAIITHCAFYVGWPKGWAVFNLAKEIWPVE